jgi:diguanylate cyclase (GGDEF)-like protein
MGSAGGSIEALPQHHEVKIVTRSGGIKWLDMTSSIVDIERKRGRLVTAVDITDRKKEDEEIRRLITVDPLTGLANYRRLVDAFDSELGRSSRTGRPFSLILLDLDELKKINDAHGHVAGSRAICRVGNVLRAQCRSLDIAARYGGDEFAVILPETCVHDAKHLASRIASAVRRDGEQPSISVSFGLAECPDNGSSFKEVLRVADGGLYLMKGKHFQETHHLEYTT